MAGWDFCKESIQDLKDRLKRQATFTRDNGISSKFLDMKNGKGGNIWILSEFIHPEINNGQKHLTIDVVCTQKSKGELSHKQFGVECCPYQYDCPKAWLEKYVPLSEDGKEWLTIAKANAYFVPQYGKVYSFEGDKYYRLMSEYSNTFYVIKTVEGKNYRIRKDELRVMIEPKDNF